MSPEGDSIARMARVLNAALAGQTVTRFEGRTAPLTSGRDARDPTGVTLTHVDARGKHLLMHFSDGRVLRSHMRMHGSWHLYRPGERWRAPASAVRAVIETDAWVAIAVNVPVAEWVAARDLTRHRALAALGPDLLADDFDAGAALTRFRQRGAEAPAGIDEAIAEALLDQRVMAGIGNVYKSEVLFLAGVSPFARVRDLRDDTLADIIAHARRLLTLNAAPTARGGRHTLSRLDPRERLWVYGRGGRPCRRCGAPISFARTGDDRRGTYWCQVCQRGPDGPDASG